VCAHVNKCICVCGCWCMIVGVGKYIHIGASTKTVYYYVFMCSMGRQQQKCVSRKDERKVARTVCIYTH